MKILIIEDEILIQSSLVKLFEAKGVNTKAVASGLQAIELIQNETFDRIICDLMLQDITGLDVIEESKKFLKHKSLSEVFIIMTAYSSKEVLRKANQYGCKIFNKPFDDIKFFMDQVLEIAPKEITYANS